MKSPRTRTIRRAADTVGGVKPLAEELGVEAEELARWLEGTSSPGTAAFLAALDIVARGPADLWSCELEQ
jgi:hypothetical protein